MRLDAGGECASASAVLGHKGLRLVEDAAGLVDPAQMRDPFRLRQVRPKHLGKLALAVLVARRHRKGQQHRRPRREDVLSGQQLVAFVPPPVLQVVEDLIGHAQVSTVGGQFLRRESQLTG